MGKKSRERHSNELLLDTSYAPPVGVEVEGISEEDYAAILTKRLHYPLALITELVGVITKEAKKAGIDDVPEEAVEGFNSVIFGGRINLVLPEGDDLRVAYDLIKSGWNDVFDAMLYATAKRLEMRSLSLDRKFKKFLEERGYEAELLVDHKEVL